ncbi:MAG: 6,7-dimethyl-8-ribityllumazine synthase [Deltaproteobacteria bacterium]|nr:6,7-dimethyl-8-ribityllumazine synthase [Deltaproteobacteria bacterium]
MRIAVVVSDFNAEITSGLLEGAVSTLVKGGVGRESIRTVHVPGAYEIPLAAKKLAEAGRWDAVVALGCVIRGETVHFYRICQATLDSLQKISLETGVPITSGILMCENWEQARVRSSTGNKHRGIEAAQAALQMAALLKDGIQA